MSGPAGPSAARPFLAPRYSLGQEAGVPLALEEGISDADAAMLGAQFASIAPWARYPYPADALARYFAAREPGAPRYLVRAGSRIVGAAGLRLEWLRGPYLQFLGVLPGAQGRGIGARILAWMEAEARASSSRNLWVAASDFNTDAIRFYKRNGFQRAADLEDLVRDGRTEILMRKRLSV